MLKLHFPENKITTTQNWRSLVGSSIFLIHQDFQYVPLLRDPSSIKGIPKDCRAYFCNSGTVSRDLDRLRLYCKGGGFHKKITITVFRFYVPQYLYHAFLRVLSRGCLVLIEFSINNVVPRARLVARLLAARENRSNQLRLRVCCWNLFSTARLALLAVPFSREVSLITQFLRQASSLVETRGLYRVFRGGWRDRRGSDSKWKNEQGICSQRASLSRKLVMKI